MKKIIGFFVLCFAVCATVIADPATVALSVKVDLGKTHFDAVRYTPETITTNSVYVEEERVETYQTNAPVWIASFSYSIPRDTPISIAGLMQAKPVRDIHLQVEMQFTLEQFEQLLGADFYASTLTAAQSYGYIGVDNQLKQILQGVIDSALSGSVDQ